MGGLMAETVEWSSIPDQSCTPPSPDIGNAGTVDSGQTETGNLCFLIFTSEASKLMLTANDEVTTAYGIAAETRWFALHK
jgi:hypothetical protein